MTDRTTTLHFADRAREAVVWLIDETDMSQDARRLTVGGAIVVLDDWYDASHNEQAVLDTLRSLSTRRYLLDVASLRQADAQTRWVCLYAVGMALDVLLVPPVVEVTA